MNLFTFFPFPMSWVASHSFCIYLLGTLMVFTDSRPVFALIIWFEIPHCGEKDLESFPLLKNNCEIHITS